MVVQIVVEAETDLIGIFVGCGGGLRWAESARSLFIVAEGRSRGHLAGDSGHRGLPTRPIVAAGGDGPGTVLQVVARSIGSGGRPEAVVQPTLAEESAGVVEPGGQVAVVLLLLDEAILKLAVLTTELRQVALHLGVLVLEVRDARLQLADGWPTRDEGRTTGASGQDRWPDGGQQGHEPRADRPPTEKRPGGGGRHGMQESG